MRFLKRYSFLRKGYPTNKRSICPIFYDQLCISHVKDRPSIPPVRRSSLSLTLNRYIKSALDSSRDKKIHESRADVVQDETGIAVQVQLRIIVFNDSAD